MEGLNQGIDEKISTHTPLTGCNVYDGVKFQYQDNFYSHTPHGVQQMGIRYVMMT